jgi:CheY-like chemotaxis protein
MNNDERLENLIRRKHCVDEAALCTALDHYHAKGIALADALVHSGVLDYGRVGALLSELHGLPYHPLLDLPPSSEAKALISLEIAEHWKVFPLELDAKRKTLVVAADDPHRPEIRDLFRTSIFASYRISLMVACREEIDRAIDIFYRGASRVPAETLNLPLGFTIIPEEHDEGHVKIEELRPQSREKVLVLDSNLARGRAVRSLLNSEGYPNVMLVSSPQEAIGILEKVELTYVLVNAHAFAEGGSWRSSMPPDVVWPPTIYYHNLAPLLLGQELTYHEVRLAVTRLVMSAVREHTRDNPQVFHDAVLRVKYCQLLSFRLGMMPSHIDKVIIAAWLADGRLPSLWREAVEIPYGIGDVLENLINEKDDVPTESIVLRIVTRFLQTHPEAGALDDVNAVRDLLKSESDSARTTQVIETFIGLLKDEQSLRNLEGPGGRILIVDPGQTEDSALVLCLKNDGYDITLAPDANTAAAHLSAEPVDLIVSELNLGTLSGIEFCRALRVNRRTARLPFVVHAVGAPKRVIAEYLNSGIDDYFDKAMDPELISLKIRKLLGRERMSMCQGIKGTISEMGLADLVQILSSGCKSVVIRLSSRGRCGEIYMQDGEIIHAHLDKAEGEDAFYQVLRWKTGEFEIMSCKDFPSRTISESPMALIMEGSRLEDEANRADNDTAVR